MSNDNTVPPCKRHKWQRDETTQRMVLVRRTRISSYYQMYEKAKCAKCEQIKWLTT